MAGVGKSYLVRYVYYKQIVTPYTSYQKFGWVDVSHPFNIRDFSWRLLLDLHSGSLQHGTMLRIRDPIQQCRQLIKKDTCLIVIDGLQTKEEWDSIKAALQLDENNVKNGSLIIVIANEKSVASHCAKHWWSVEGLEIDDALHLFNKTATRTNWWEVSFWPNDPSPSDIERATCVLHKCGGLPKVIVAVANAFADGWRIDVDSFMQLLMNNQAFGSLRDLFSWVDSYLRSFPDSLKPCIFYLSIFPVNHKIRRMRLVRRWVAEGYCMDTKEETAEEKGEQSCLELCRRNIVHVPGSTSMSYMMRMPPCQVNGFFREYIVSRSMEENLVFALEGHCSVNKQHTGRHLAIGSTWDRDMSVYRGIDVSRLRSLTVFGKWDPFFITDKMRLVRVLDLEDASSVTDCDLKLIVKLLPHIKFLSLRRCKEISHLPDSFGSLKQLQTLDIRHTSVVKLPQSIIKLQKLQHICAGTAVPMDGDSSTVESIPSPLEAASASASMNRPCDATLVSQLKSWKPWTRCSQELPTCHNGGIELPRGIGKMMALTKITVVDVGIACGRPILEELKNLIQLRKLGLSGIKREICEALCSAISAFIHLESLSLWLEKSQTGCLDAISSPPEKLKILKLYGYTGKLPAWIHMLSNLSKLKIQKDMIMQDDVDLPNSLPNLNTLNLSSKEFQHGQFRFHPHFQQLQVLEINCNNRLQAVKFQPGVMPRIEVLRIFCHDVSSLRFSGLQQLINLRDVTLSGSYDERVKQSLELELGEYWQPCSTSSTSHGALVRWRRASQ
ncbi:hypothetical protein HU200_044045 [Digitaria exilis]|uniref:NB-ARC domain-containing protein n=1 Tax=Digitaria exilis TaxID=1010633 RepID=A0A835EDA8_9POAL|nr:hypothetical protein HU200_044045 [Digitaria exilis]